MNEQQEMREKEISLTDLFFYCMERWRYILLFMLIMGILAGAYKYLATVRSNQAIIQNEKSADKSESAKTAGGAAEPDDADVDKAGGNGADMGEIDIEPSDIYAQSVESYKRAIWENQQSLEKQKGYLDHSAVMQIDPYHVSTGTLSYYIDGGEHLDSLLAAYRAFIQDGRMAEELHGKNKEISIEDLRYLVTFSNSEREAYRLEDNQVIRPKEMVFQVQIKMQDDELCDSYLKEAEKIIGDYSSQLKKDVAKHGLKLLASVQSEQSDAELQSYQATIRGAYVEAARSLQTLQTELDAAMSLVTEEGTAASSAGAEGELANPVISGAKYAVVGLILGAFFACFCMAVLYIMSGRLQSTRGFAEEFGMPMLGLARDTDTKKRWFGWIDAWIIRLEEGAYGKLGFEEQVKLATANVQAALTKAGKDSEVKKVMLAGTMPEKEVASLYAKLVSELSEIEGLSISDYTQIVFQADALKKLEDFDGILFLEKRCASESRFIVKERGLALDRGVRILGTVVLA